MPQPEDDPRMAWVVADEGRGMSLVMEVLHPGDRNKDLVTGRRFGIRLAWLIHPSRSS
ncbi:hypothetical protein WME91_18855 [Sorangium sp. So ce269]